MAQWRQQRCDGGNSTVVVPDLKAVEAREVGPVHEGDKL